MPINIVLLEFFVDNVKIDEHVRASMPQMDKGQLCVAFKFLDFPALYVYQEMVGGAAACVPPVFRSGRSGLFSVPDMCDIPPDLFMIDIEVMLKTMPTACPECPDITPIGRTAINITRDFSAISAEAKAFPARVPVTRTLRDSFLMANRQGKVVGVVAVFVRASCFGDMIVQQFRRGAGTCVPPPPDCPAPCGDSPANFPGRPVVAPCAQPQPRPCQALPSGLLESLREGIARGLDPDAPAYLGDVAAAGGGRDLGPCVSRPSTAASRATLSCPSSSRRGGDYDYDEDEDAEYEDARDEDTCVCKEEALAATAPRPPGHKCDEIGTEVNGSFLTIRVPRSDHKPSKERRDLQGLALKYGYVLPNPVPCICGDGEECTCGAREAAEGGGAGAGDGRRPHRHHRHRHRRRHADDDYGADDMGPCSRAGVRLSLPPLTEKDVEGKRDPDLDNDVFVLKIGTARLGERQPPKRPKLELLLRTPRRAGPRGKACAETQYLDSDVPPGAAPAAAAKGKGAKGGKGKKGKKGKKK